MLVQRGVNPSHDLVYRGIEPILHLNFTELNICQNNVLTIYAVTAMHATTS
jgi:hypothetical protein